VATKSEKDSLGIFDDVQQVEAKPVAIGAVASLVALVALGVLFVLTVVWVAMNIVGPWIWRFLAIGGSYCSRC